MKIWKLVSGILSIVFSVLLLLQSCTVGALEAVSEAGSVNGGLGLVVAVFMMTIGITSIAVRKGTRGNIALLILSLLGAVLGFAASKDFPDLKIWAAWLLIIAFFAIVAMIINGVSRKKALKNTADSESN